MNRTTRSRAALPLICYGTAALLVVSFLRAPEPRSSRGFWGEYRQLASGFGFVLNRDSFAFIHAGREPGILLTKDYLWQSRPGYIALGAVLTRVMRLVAPASFDAYLAFLLINVAALAAAVALFVRVLRNAGIGEPLALPASMLLASNEVVKTFFFTPHLQIIGLLAPALALYLADRQLRAAEFRVGPVLWTALWIGLGLLVYGALLLALAGVMCAAVYTAWRSPRRASALAQIVLAGVVGAAPLTAWILFVRWKTGSFYSHETASYHQFVWILEALRSAPGMRAETFRTHWVTFTATLAPEVIPASCIVGALAASSAGVHALRPWDHRGLDRVALAAALIVISLYTAFLAGMGFYAPRLTFALVPPLVVVGMVFLNALLPTTPRATAIAGAAIALLVLVRHVSVLTSYGPFS